MAVVVEHLLERPLVNHGLPALEARALLALERLDRHRAKLNALHRPPRFRVALQNPHSVKARVGERAHEPALRQCAADAAAPQLGIVLHRQRHFLVAHDVADHGAPALPQHAENFLEKLPLRAALHKIEHAV